MLPFYPIWLPKDPFVLIKTTVAFTSFLDEHDFGFDTQTRGITLLTRQILISLC